MYLNTVHDSIVIDVHPSEEDVVLNIIRDTNKSLINMINFSPMSRFAPPSLLGHPGLSQAAAAAAAAAGHHHLPQIKQELNGRPSHKNSPSKRNINFKTKVT